MRSFVILALALSFSLARARAESAPHVLSFVPVGPVKNIHQVHAEFSTPMVPFGDPRGLEAPFDRSCTIPGNGHWIDPKNWVFDFSSTLTSGVACTFTLKQSARTLSGQALSGQRQFFFTTGGPTVSRTEPWVGERGIREDQAFLLYFDAEPKKESLLSHVYFVVDGLVERVEINLIEGKDRDQILKERSRWGDSKQHFFPVIVQARRRFPSGVRVTLVVGQGLEATTGVGRLHDEELSYRVREPFTAKFSCERENAHSDCIPFNSMSVSFSAPITREQAKKVRLVTADGAVHTRKERKQSSGTSDEEADVSYLSFPPPFPASSEIRVELPKDLTDEIGRSLSNADRFPLTVKTSMMPPLAKFPAEFGILEAKASPILPVTLRNVETDLQTKLLGLSPGTEGGPADQIDGKMLRVTGAKVATLIKLLDLVHQHADNYSLRTESVMADSRLMAKAGEIESLVVKKPLGSKSMEVVGIPLKTPGLYVVELKSPALGSQLIGAGSDMYVSTAALVTNLSVHFKLGREASLAWVTSLDSGHPVSGARVAVWNCRGESLARGKTDEHGIVWFEESPFRSELKSASCVDVPSHPFSQGLLITAEKDDDYSFVHTSWDHGIEPWRFQLPTDDWSGPNIAHTIFDRTLFRAGETVHLQHVLRRHGRGGFYSVPENERPNRVEITHLGSGQSYELSLTWDSSDTAENEWTIPAGAKLGEYQVTLKRKDPHAASSSEGGSSVVVVAPPVEYNSGSFRVEEYRVPLMKAQIAPPQGAGCRCELGSGRCRRRVPGWRARRGYPGATALSGAKARAKRVHLISGVRVCERQGGRGLRSSERFRG